MTAASLKTSGSFLRIHIDLGPPHSADTGPNPEYFSAESPVRASSSASAAARTSIHSRAGRRTLLFLSTATTVADVESTPMPAIASTATPAFSTAARTEATIQVHHSAGSCSALPDRGKSVLHSVATEASSFPSKSKTPARAPPVPISIPSRYGPSVIADSSSLIPREFLRASMPCPQSRPERVSQASFPRPLLI